MPKVKKVRKIRKIRKLKPKFSLDIKGKRITKGKKRYIEGWHKTWDGKKVYLRSGYEFRFAKKLDKQKIGYEVESLSFFYFDTKLKKIKRAFPDFYIPSQNLVVEIKGSHLLDLQNIRDRKKKIEEEGYKFELIVDNKKFKLD